MKPKNQRRATQVLTLGSTFALATSLSVIHPRPVPGGTGGRIVAEEVVEACLHNLSVSVKAASESHRSESRFQERSDAAMDQESRKALHAADKVIAEDQVGGLTFRV